MSAGEGEAGVRLDRSERVSLTPVLRTRMGCNVHELQSIIGLFDDLVSAYKPRSAAYIPRRCGKGDST
jgi:hypothetical protein